MTDYEILLDEAAGNSIQVYENYDLGGTRLKGLYCDGSVALNKELSTTVEKKSILTEELGHYYTTVGDITDLSDTNSRKQEHRAHIWAYNKVIGTQGLIAASLHGCRSFHEMADYLEVTEAFLLEALDYYKSKYGLYVQVDHYILFFEPLGVLTVYPFQADLA